MIFFLFCYFYMLLALQRLRLLQCTMSVWPVGASQSCATKQYSICVNSLAPGDVTRLHRTGSTLAQVRACCLMAPSHYLNRCWLIISEVRSCSINLIAVLQEMLELLKCVWKLHNPSDCLHCLAIVIDYCQTSNISRTLVGNKIVDHSDVVGALPVSSAPTTSSFSI